MRNVAEVARHIAVAPLRQHAMQRLAAGQARGVGATDGLPHFFSTPGLGNWGTSARWRRCGRARRRRPAAASSLADDAGLSSNGDGGFGQSFLWIICSQDVRWIRTRQTGSSWRCCNKDVAEDCRLVRLPEWSEQFVKDGQRRWTARYPCPQRRPHRRRASHRPRAVSVDRPYGTVAELDRQRTSRASIHTCVSRTRPIGSS